MGWCEQQGISGRNRRKLGWYMSHKRCTSWLSPCGSAQALSFVRWRQIWLRLSLFAVIHLLDEQIHGGSCDYIYLLADGGDWNYGFVGNWWCRSRLSHSCRKAAVFLYDKIQNMLAYVSFARNTPFFLSGYFSSILLKITFI